MTSSIMGCDSSTGPPTPPIAVDLSLSAPSGGAHAPIEIVLSVTNLGPPVGTWGGCGCDPLSFGLFDPDGKPVRLGNPCEVGPLCPCGMQIFQHRAHVAARLVIDGTTWDDACEPVDLAPGKYTLVGTFYYTLEGSSRSAQRTLSFDWKGTSEDS